MLSPDTLPRPRTNHHAPATAAAKTMTNAMRRKDLIISVRCSLRFGSMPAETALFDGQRRCGATAELLGRIEQAGLGSRPSIRSGRDGAHQIVQHVHARS